MVRRWFEHTVSALVYEVGRQHSEGLGPGFEPPFNDVARFVLRQYNGMPGFLAFPLQIATLVFSFSAVLPGGALFHQLDPARRRMHMRKWQLSRLGICRDLMRFYASVAVLALYARFTDRLVSSC